MTNSSPVEYSDRRRKAGKQRGFILAETLVAVAIIGTGILASMSALSTASLTTEKVKNDATASWIATSELELIKLSAFVPTPGTYTNITPPSGFTVQNTTSAFSGGDSFIQTVTVKVFNGSKELISIEMVKVDR